MFLMLDLNETFKEDSEWILMKLSQKLLKDDPYHLTPPQGSSGTTMSCKNPGRELEDRWGLDRVSDVGS